jgi:hypothetical protein
MKLLSSLLLGLLSAGALSAQTPSTPSQPPGVSVVKFSWQKDVFVPALYDDPMGPNQEQLNLRRQQRIIKRAQPARTGAGQAPLPQPTRDINLANRDMPEGPSINYIYEAKIRNEGAKTIKSIVWEYLIYDPQTVTLVGRHTFLDELRLRPGKAVNLVAFTASPPNMILQADKQGKSSDHKYEESVIISRIEFEDGTSWQRATE